MLYQWHTFPGTELFAKYVFLVVLGKLCGVSCVGCVGCPFICSQTFLIVFVSFLAMSIELNTLDDVGNSDASTKIF